jgi:HJR/Mrr/RecB family endonuclease
VHAAAVATILVYLLYRGIRWSCEAPGRRRYEQAMRTVSLSGVDQMTGVEFEEYVKHLVESRGYTCTLTPHSGDFRLDIVAIDV